MTREAKIDRQIKRLVQAVAEGDKHAPDTIYYLIQERAALLRRPYK